MTEPRWAADAPPDGRGANPNERLAPFMAACREVAAECRVPLVDHFARWTRAEANGQRSATGRPTVATRTLEAIVSSPMRCGPS